MTLCVIYNNYSTSAPSSTHPASHPPKTQLPPPTHTSCDSLPLVYVLSWSPALDDSPDLGSWSPASPPCVCPPLCHRTSGPGTASLTPGPEISQVVIHWKLFSGYEDSVHSSQRIYTDLLISVCSFSHQMFGRNFILHVWIWLFVS